MDWKEIRTDELIYMRRDEELYLRIKDKEIKQQAEYLAMLERQREDVVQELAAITKELEHRL